MVSSAEISKDVLVPRYYDPIIDQRLETLRRTHDLISIGQLIAQGDLQLRQGNYIGKMHYGTGTVPYIRTSDIANWELRTSPKHGVSEDIYTQYVDQQDIREHDILLVHEGSYLIGTPCMLTRHDTRVLYQHHLAKLRVPESSQFTPELLIAALLSPIVQMQIRARQFTADIIDSIVGRLPEVQLPVPRNPDVRQSIEEEVREIFDGRAEGRVRLARLFRRLDAALASGRLATLVSGLAEEDEVESGLISFLGGKFGAQYFTHPSTLVENDILIPRYYDPGTKSELTKLSSHCNLISIGNLADSGQLELRTGHEVGKIAYGGEDVPFVRTSDLGNWELKHDPKQRVSWETYEEYATRQTVQEEDLLLVRDGTYLVGSTAMVQEPDVPMLFSGGIYRIRSVDPERLDPYLLLALLNSGVVRRQMRNKQFTRDVIDTLGHRVREIQLPFPRDPAVAADIARIFRQVVLARTDLRVRASLLGAALERV